MPHVQNYGAQAPSPASRHGHRGNQATRASPENLRIVQAPAKAGAFSFVLALSNYRPGMNVMDGRRQNMKTRVLTLIVAALASAFAYASGDPNDALKAITQYQQEYRKQAQESGTSLNFAEMNAKIKDMALEAIDGVRPSEVDPESAHSWSRLYVYAQKWEDIHELCDRFHESSPNDAESYSAHMMCLQAFRSMGKSDQAAETIGEMPLPSVMNAYSVASMAANYFAAPLAKEQGMDAVKKMLDSIEAKIPEPGTGQNDERYYNLAHTQVVIGYANGLKATDGATAAVKFLDSRIAATEDEALKASLTSSARSMKAEVTREALVGNAAPGFEFVAEIGGFKGLESLKGKVVVLDFFAHWCGPCIRSFPDVRKMYDDLKGEGLEIVGITTYYGYFGSENREKRDMERDVEQSLMPAFMEKYDMNWNVSFIERDVFDSYGITGIPTAYLIDRDGNVHSYKVGYSAESFAKFRKKVEELLKK